MARYCSKNRKAIQRIIAKMIKVKGKILVTGGAGFIGSHLVDKLVDYGYQVVIVDDFSSGKIENINKRATFIKKDITSKDFTTHLNEVKPEIIFHLAAQTSLTKSTKYPERDLQINLLAVQDLLDAAKSINVQKIIFASSTAIYGHPTNLPLKENSIKNPISIYGMAKLSAEFLFKYFFNQYKLPYVSLRYANVYGERQNSTAEGGVIAIFINKMLNNQTIQIFGDGKQTRDFIYISDVIDANIAALNNRIIGELNVGTGIQTSVNNLFIKLKKITKSKSSQAYQQPKFIEINENSLSYSKFHKTSGWKPEVKLNDGLLKTVEYFKQNLTKL